MEGLDHDANDVHICGVCKSQFNTLDDFIHHKASHLRIQTKQLGLSENPRLTIPEGNMCPRNGVFSSSMSQISFSEQSTQDVLMDQNSISAEYGRPDFPSHMCLDSVSHISQTFLNEIVPQDVATKQKKDSSPSTHESLSLASVEIIENDDFDFKLMTSISHEGLHSRQEILMGQLQNEPHLPEQEPHRAKDVAFSNKSMQQITFQRKVSHLKPRTPGHLAPMSTFPNILSSQSPECELNAPVNTTSHHKKTSQASTIGSSAAYLGSSTSDLTNFADQNTEKNDGKSSTRKRMSCSAVGCSYSTRFSKDLSRHMRAHTGEKPYECLTCRKRFSRQDKLKGHVRIHNGEKPHKCNLCNYATTDSGSLKKHIRVHTDDRPFQCQLCPYRSKDSSQLTVHLRFHTGDCPFVCHVDGCKSSFKTNSDLKRHSRTHTGEKPFECPHCSYRCAIKSNIKNHILSNHQDTPEAFFCKLCNHHATSKVELRSHEKSHAAPTFKCSQCSFTCGSKLALTNHSRKQHTSTKSICCKYCNFSNKCENVVIAHMDKKHGSLIEKGAKSKTKPMKGKGKQHMAVKKADAVGTSPSVGKVVKKVMRPLKARSVCEPHLLCNLCPASFVRKDSLRSHLKQHAKQPNSESSRVCPISPLVTEKVVPHNSPRKILPAITESNRFSSPMEVLAPKPTSKSTCNQIEESKRPSLIVTQQPQLHFGPPLSVPPQLTASTVYFPTSQISVDPSTVQAAQILSSFKFDDFYNSHQKLVSSTVEPLTIAPGATAIQYVLAPNPLSMSTEVQVIHAAPQQMLVHHFNHVDKKIMKH